MSDELTFTGERFIPGVLGEIWIEHWHRYHFAARWAAGKRVLDVACGEGYGSAALARRAAHVTGVDLSEAAVAHARAAYAGAGNLDFVAASCTRMPLADASFDLAVSFETVEHIEEQEAFLAELARVLKPGGLLVMSSPNKLEYSDRRGFANEFHVKELYREQLEQLVGAHFPALAWYGQRPSFFSVIAPEAAGGAAGELFEVGEGDPLATAPALASPLYFVLVAAREPAAIEALPPAVSVLADRDHWVQRDYEKVMDDLSHAVPRAEFAEKLVHERDQLIAALQQQAREAQVAMQAEVARVSAERAHEVAELQSRLAAATAESATRLATIEAQQHEILRRGGLRWWLRLPLHRFGILK